MASDNKTEKPTPRKIQQAREQGQVAKSQDMNSAISLGTATLGIAFIGPYTFTMVYSMMQYSLSHLSARPMTLASFSQTLQQTIESIVWLLFPFLLMMLCMGVLSNLVQIKPLFTVKPLMPKLEKINPLKGFQRLWSLRSIVEVVKSLIKMTVIGVSGVLIIKGHIGELMMLGSVEVSLAWSTIFQVMGQIALWATILFLILGMVDWWYQSYELEKQLRMTKQDIKDERKNQEGDPMIKSRIRQVGIQISKNKQLAMVPTADVVITNPTHFSIAIRYDPDEAPAPRVIAKGQDHFAFKIREVAKEHNIPLVENKPLARSLYAMVEVEHMIPPELFVAVAEVMAFVFSKNKGRKLHKLKGRRPS